VKLPTKRLAVLHQLNVADTAYLGLGFVLISKVCSLMLRLVILLMLNKATENRLISKRNLGPESFDMILHFRKSLD
jgi:hypothetical protein